MHIYSLWQGTGKQCPVKNVMVTELLDRDSLESVFASLLPFLHFDFVFEDSLYSWRGSMIGSWLSGCHFNLFL